MNFKDSYYTDLMIIDANALIDKATFTVALFRITNLQQLSNAVCMVCGQPCLCSETTYKSLF